MGPGFIASRLHHRDHRRAGEQHRSQHITGSVRYGVAHALLHEGHRDGLARQLYGQQQASATLRFHHHRPRYTAFERGLIIATGTETRAPRSSHFALLFVDHCLTHRRHHSPAACRQQFSPIEDPPSTIYTAYLQLWYLTVALI